MVLSFMLEVDDMGLAWMRLECLLDSDQEWNEASTALYVFSSASKIPTSAASATISKIAY
jgi:hypothetical protein